MSIRRSHTNVVLVGYEASLVKLVILCLVQVGLHVGVQVPLVVHIANVVDVHFRVLRHGLRLRAQKLLSLRTLMFDCARYNFLFSGNVGLG